MSTQMTTGTRLATDVQPEVGKETVWEIDPTHTLVEFTVMNARRQACWRLRRV